MLRAIGWLFRPMTVGRLFRVPVRVTPTVLVLTVALLAWAAERGGLRGMRALGELFALLVVSLLCHELGHALAARRLGLSVRDITIWPLGGAARLEGLARRPGAEAPVSLAGPGANLLLAGGCALLPGALARAALWMNLALALGNLVPAFPLDGGRALRSWLALGSPLPDATRAAVRISRWLALGVAAGCWSIGALPLGLLLAAYVLVAGWTELARVVAQTGRLPALSFSEVLRRAACRRGPGAAAEPPAGPATLEELERFRGRLDEYFRRRPRPPRP